MSTEYIINQWYHLLLGLDRKVLALIAWFLIAFITISPLEKFFYLKPQKIFRKDFITDTLYFFISGILPAFILVVTTGLTIIIFRSILPTAWFTYVQSLPLWFRLLAIVMAADFGFYWAHRWAHEIPFIWRIHSIHHSPTEINWLVATRVHPLEIIFLRSISFVPVFGLGLVDLTASKADIYSLMLLNFNTLWGIFIHANVKFRFGWLEHIIATPHFHHWHHTNDNHQVINKNYAALLPIYDRLFGSLYQPKASFPVKYGISTPLPDGLLRQLAYPFVWLFAKKQNSQKKN